MIGGQIFPLYSLFYNSIFYAMFLNNITKEVKKMMNIISLSRRVSGRITVGTILIATLFLLVSGYAGAATSANITITVTLLP